MKEISLEQQNQSGQAEKPYWKKCSSCKNPIPYSTKYYVCSVSTCNGERTGYVFCSISCFERHLPGANHRSAGAIEKVSPANVSAQPTTHQPQRIMIRPQVSPVSSSQNKSQIQEVLVIASRLKEYIQAQSEFNTSASVMNVLSDYLRVLCDRAIDNARADGRKTVMDRDFEFLKKN